MLYEKLFRVLVESTNVLISYESPYCDLCWDKNRSEPYNSDTQDGGGKQKIKGKQLAKQERSIAWNWEASNPHQDPASLKLQAHTQSHLKILHHKRAEHQESSVVRGAASLTPYLIQNHLWQKDTRPPRVSPRLSSTRALWPHFQPLAWEHVWGQLAFESNTTVHDFYCSEIIGFVSWEKNHSSLFAPFFWNLLRFNLICCIELTTNSQCLVTDGNVWRRFLQ